MLSIVSTPIGNIEDISLRAIRTLKESDYVLAEDTRRTGRLFLHYGIKTKMVSYNDHSKERKTPAVIRDLEAGKRIALVTDSGTPGISDPGFYLVRECHRNNITVSPVPGASAVLSALVASGLPTDKFVFYGFLPKSKKRRREVFKTLECTTVFYESPHRLHNALLDLKEVLPEAEVVVAREMTKKFEEFIRGKPGEIIEKLKLRNVKGEITIIAGGVRH